MRTPGWGLGDPLRAPAEGGSGGALCTGCGSAVPAAAAAAFVPGGPGSGGARREPRPGSFPGVSRHGPQGCRQPGGGALPGAAPLMQCYKFISFGFFCPRFHFPPFFIVVVIIISAGVGYWAILAAHREHQGCRPGQLSRSVRRCRLFTPGVKYSCCARRCPK